MVYEITGHFKRLTGNNFNIMLCITTRIVFWSRCNFASISLFGFWRASSVQISNSRSIFKMSCFLRFQTGQILSTAGGLKIQNSHDKNNSPRFPAISGIWLNANRRWTMFRFYMLKDLPDHFDLHKVLASMIIGLMPIPKSLLGILLGKEFRFWLSTKKFHIISLTLWKL